ncbi:hypothetical protein RhiirA1_396392 [Rhizophagus irregularis]|uniref:Uncharacterized protein n=1 Tax=Rhizophagus irregularis TaxID=588596 RepID=A0A2I1F1I9_9GLOM|nr:hypothetical protein RhiirA1_396392 [Rhizophagus irregularis]PKY28239.1 hypothetical protein RhiirB3_444315 [Rhizophagus irregularis]
MMKKVGYIERLEVKRNYKYKTVRARIRLIKEMEEVFLKGRSNIALTKNDRKYFFRMFDVKLDATIPRSKEEHEELDDLNNKFSERLDKIEKKKEEITTEEIVTTVEELDKVNGNKKRVVTT